MKGLKIKKLRNYQSLVQMNIFVNLNWKRGGGGMFCRLMSTIPQKMLSD